MARKILWGAAILAAIVFFLLAVSVVLLALFGTSASVGGTLPSGRSVTASAKSILVSFESSGNTAIVRTWGREVTIAPAQFTIDGQYSGPLPATAKAVVVKFEGDDVSITADGVPVKVR